VEPDEEDERRSQAAENHQKENLNNV